MAAISFQPKQITKRFLAVLPERAHNVLTARYGLGDDPNKKTLESIGEMYGITRERVRQVENAALAQIRKSDVFKDESHVFEELREIMLDLGGVVSEEEFLAHITSNKSTQNHVNFLLELGEPFRDSREDAEFHKRWSVDEETAAQVHGSLRQLYKSLSDEDLIPEGEFVTRFLEHLQDVSDRYKNEEIVKRWLSLSKSIGRNPLGEWGMATSPHVRARGMRDYAYLVLRRRGSPMHFTEVAEAISEVFNKKAHVATCHNELIKDDRFVLVGRGLYALSEWGYERGVVKNVIHRILREKGPLTKQQIVDEVMKERHVKENTILVNLQDDNYFTRSGNGTYAAV